MFPGIFFPPEVAEDTWARGPSHCSAPGTWGGELELTREGKGAQMACPILRRQPQTAQTAGKHILWLSGEVYLGVCSFLLPALGVAEGFCAYSQGYLQREMFGLFL